MRSLGIILGTFLFIFLVCPTSSHAIIIFGDVANSTEGIGDFTGELTYTYNEILKKGTLVVELTNTTPLPATLAYITGFVFNNPSDSISGVNFVDSDFSLLGAAAFNNNVSGASFGDFDIGAALGGDFLGGGSPNAGISIGSTKTFTFGLTGTDLLGALTDQSFVGELSDDASEGRDEQFFVVRIRGINTGAGSDKIPATTETPPIPEPATMILLGSGLLGLAFARRKRS